MPFQLLDLILAGIMLVSGLLALMRGFTREVLSLIAWGAAAVAAYFAIHSPELVAYASKYLQPEIVAKIAVGAAVFLIVLIIVSLISVKLSDAVVDSAAGAFDRTLGFDLWPGARPRPRRHRLSLLWLAHSGRAPGGMGPQRPFAAAHPVGWRNDPVAGAARYCRNADQCFDHRQPAIHVGDGATRIGRDRRPG